MAKSRWLSNTVGTLISSWGIGAKATRGTLDMSRLTAGRTFKYPDLSAGTVMLSLPAPPGGRLTLTSGSAVPTSDTFSASTIYYTPWKSTQAFLYDGTVWNQYTFPQLSLAIGTLTSSKPYDIFMYLSSGSPALEFGPAWTNATTRATNVVLQDGLWVKSGATDRLYLGTMYTANGTNTSDAISQMQLYNASSWYGAPSGRWVEAYDGTLVTATTTTYTTLGSLGPMYAMIGLPTDVRFIYQGMAQASAGSGQIGCYTNNSSSGSQYDELLTNINGTFYNVPQLMDNTIRGALGFYTITAQHKVASTGQNAQYYRRRLWVAGLDR